MPDTKFDVDFLTRTFNGECYSRNVDRFSDTAASNQKESDLDSFKRRFKEIADKSATNSCFIGYLSGHMEKDKDGNLFYLLPDFDGTNYDVAACPAAYIFDVMQSCKASMKFLFIDACYSGSDCWKEKDGVRANFTTITSSGANEKSLIWKERKRSHFSFWLNYGLRGYADHNHDGPVTPEELFEYVELHTYNSSALTGNAHTPCLINPSATEAFVFRPTPLKLKIRCEEFAELTSATLQIHKFGRPESEKFLLGIPEFSTGDREEHVVNRAIYGENSLQAKSELRKYMGKSNQQRPGGNKTDLYGFLNDVRLNEVLRQNDVKIGGLDSASVEKGLRSEFIEATYDNIILIDGNICLCDENSSVATSLRFLDGFGEDIIEDIYCRALVDNSYRINGGGSYAITYDKITDNVQPSIQETVDMPNPQPTVVLTTRPGSVELLKTHPLDPNSKEQCGVKVSFLSRAINSFEPYSPVPITFKDGNANIEFKVGLEFAIQISSSDGTEHMARITVDGHDTAAFVNSQFVGNVDKIEDWELTSITDATPWYVPKDREMLCKGYSKINKTNPAKSYIRRFSVKTPFAYENHAEEYSPQAGIISFLVCGKKEVTTRGGSEPVTPGVKEDASFSTIEMNQLNEGCKFEVHFSVVE